MYVVWSVILRDVDSLAAPPVNGFVGFGGAGIANTGILAPWALPAVGCVVTGPPPVLFPSSTSPKSSYN